MLCRRNFVSVVLSLFVWSIATIAHAQTKPTLTKPLAIEWQTDPAVARELGLKTERPVLVFVSAEWCLYCQKMKREVWSNPDVIRLVREQFVPLHLDADNYPDAVAELKVEAFPTTLVLSSKKPLPDKVVGYVPATQLLMYLKRTSEFKAKQPTMARS